MPVAEAAVLILPQECNILYFLFNYAQLDHDLVEFIAKHFPHASYQILQHIPTVCSRKLIMVALESRRVLDELCPLAENLNLVHCHVAAWSAGNALRGQSV